MYSENDFRSYELAHHGILGQKWGVRRGKNYPLEANEHSAAEKKAGWRKSLDKDPRGQSSSGQSEKSDAKGTKGQGLTDKQKTAIKVGVGVAAAALVAYGGYKLAKSGVVQDAMAKGAEKITSMKNDIYTKEFNKTINKVGVGVDRFDKGKISVSEAESRIKMLNKAFRSKDKFANENTLQYLDDFRPRTIEDAHARALSIASNTHTSNEAKRKALETIGKAQEIKPDKIKDFVESYMKPDKLEDGMYYLRKYT